ncbi:MAG: hypothetical protein GY720_07850, partial [bacterium]|nr:hypothetical protein [bacterium]
MKHESHCSRVPQEAVDASLAATRSHFQNQLAESCQAAGQDTVCPELDARLTACLDHFLPAYVRADLSACRHYRAYAWASTAVFILGALAVIIVATQHIFHLPHPIVIGEIACIGMILFIFHWGNRRRLHRTWVDCRHFAERV